jgi:hypothetical protein
LVAVLALGMLAGTVGSDPTVAEQTPLGASYGYFAALNGANPLSAEGYLAPDSKLADGGVSLLDGFENVQCRPASESNAEITDTGTRAVVVCEFDIREDWGGFSAGHYHWGVLLERQPPGPWLIYDWGQG